MASTIAIVREDFSIPGSEQDRLGVQEDRSELERRFFRLLSDNRPDVVVLDLVVTKGQAVAAIRKIREQSGVPILAVCASQDPLAADYRTAGAADCLTAPVEIANFNATIQNIIRLTQAGPDARPRQSGTLSFGGITYRPDQNALRSADGASVKLTTFENHLLSHFLARSWTVCSRAEIADVVYGRHRPGSYRAVDVLVNRLRKKLVSACGPTGDSLVKTEFRRGYILVADVATVPHQLQPELAQGGAS